MPQPHTPANRPPQIQPQPSPLRRKLTDTVAPSAIDACEAAPSALPTEPVAAIASLPTASPCEQADGHDPAMLVGLSLWTARQHERYIEAAATRNDGRPLHIYPTVLVDTLRRHADAGDPTCRLVLDWLLGKGLLETGAGRSRKGAF
ncbi:hypothetical protein [Aureimonas glaciei]|uniref:Uncharacterized protein n=1 Tax=Aureimonas glaciei TaxID=1776957 RepID=A0A916Y847_9HYPH|nr:hypothetical protein [Aureimonas glaciei]GGD34862.1 hypothetical protein GCM10011335_42370 [Aureimonas glaciei]